jgi:hypothetical protein
MGSKGPAPDELSTVARKSARDPVGGRWQLPGNPMGESMLVDSSFFQHPSALDVGGRTMAIACQSSGLGHARG